MSDLPRIFVTRRLPGGALDLLAEKTKMEVWPGELPPSREELLHCASECHGLLALLTERIDDELLAAAPRLRVVSNMATGVDNIDLTAASRHNVLVTRTPGVLSQTVADFTFTLLLAAARRVAEGDRHVRRGLWKSWGPEVMLGQDVYGATLGIIGMGGIGQEVAKRARGFGMQVVYNSRTPKPALEKRYRYRYLSLDDLLRASDFVSVHAPLTAETRYLIGRRELALMKRTAILVNTARGPLVDEAALYQALCERVIAAAALDVTDPEPVSLESPLLSLENVVITPHIASASVATRSRMALLAATNLLQALTGRVPKHTANLEVVPAWRSAWSARRTSP